MSPDVPDRWRIIRLGDAAREARVRNGSREIPQDRLVGVFKGEGMIPTRDRVRGETIDRCKIVRPGAFAYNPMRLNIGSIARWHGSEPAIVSPDYIVFEADPALLDEAFLDHLRSSAPWRKFTESAGDGGVRVRIYFDHLAEFRFPLPPLPEQRRIAEILSSVDETIQATQAVIEQTRKVKQAVIERLLTKGINHTRFKHTKAGELPDAWKAAHVGEIIRLTSGKLKSTRSLLPQQTDDAPYPVYGGNGIAGFDSDFLVDGERIVIGRVGAYCGAIYRSSGKVWITDNALYTQEFLKEVDPDFLSHALSRIPLDRIRRGGGQPLISQKPLYEQLVALPPIDEQRHIAEIVSSFDVLYDGKGLSRLQRLKNSLMSDLLTGRKRVIRDLRVAAE